jgi:hypothetical protein
VQCCLARRFVSITHFFLPTGAKNLPAVATNIGKGVTLEMLDQAGYMATL